MGHMRQQSRKEKEVLGVGSGGTREDQGHGQDQGGGESTETYFA